MFRSPWGTLDMLTSKDNQTTRSDKRRAALAHIRLAGRNQPVSLRVRPSSQMVRNFTPRHLATKQQHATLPMSTLLQTRPLWTPIVYHYSRCSAWQAEEESVIIASDEVFIRSNYLTIPHRTDCPSQKDLELTHFSFLTSFQS